MNKKLLIILCTCVAVIIAGSIGIWTHEKNLSADSTIMPSNITVNGINVSDMTKRDAKEELIEQSNKDDFTIKTEDGEQVLPMDGMKYSLYDSLDGIVAKEGFFKYVCHLFGQKYEVTIPMEVYETTEEFDSTLEEFIKNEDKGTTKTKDASVDLSTNEFRVIRETYGDNLDQKKLEDAILTAIEEGSHSLKYSHADFIKVPEITADSPEIQEKLDYCNKYLKTQITYSFGNEKVTLTPAQLDEMINVKTGELKLRQKKVEEYVAGLAAKYDTYYLRRNFKTTSGREVVLNAGTYGYIIDQAAEVKQLKKDIKAGKDLEREPVYSCKGYGRNGINDIPSSYVEVDLSAQCVYCYKNGKRVISAPCVSGCLKPDKTGAVHETVCGVFSIAYKERDATLRGGSKTDETDYESEVRYWMPFFNGIGLHDADWRDEFGGTIYKKNGSHGCINLPIPAAEKIFNNVEAGTVVIVYY